MKTRKLKTRNRARRRLRRLPRHFCCLGPSLEQRVDLSDLRDVVRAYRIEGRALAGFEAAKIRAVAAMYGKDEIIALAWRFGLRFGTRAPKEALLGAFYDALLVAPTFDAAGRLVAPRFVWRGDERKFDRTDKRNEKKGEEK